MQNRDLIISNEWSLEGNILKVTARRKENIYSVFSEVVTYIQVGNPDSQYFVFDETGIQCLYDADTGLTYPFTRTSAGELKLSESSGRKLHVWTQFMQFLFTEFLRNSVVR